MGNGTAYQHLRKNGDLKNQVTKIKHKLCINIVVTNVVCLFLGKWECEEK